MHRAHALNDDAAAPFSTNGGGSPRLCLNLILVMRDRAWFQRGDAFFCVLLDFGSQKLDFVHDRPFCDKWAQEMGRGAFY